MSVIKTIHVNFSITQLRFHKKIGQGQGMNASKHNFETLPDWIALDTELV